VSSIDQVGNDGAFRTTVMGGIRSQLIGGFFVGADVILSNQHGVAPESSYDVLAMNRWRSGLSIYASFEDGIKHFRGNYLELGVEYRFSQP
jgi:hypothetical protein